MANSLVRRVSQVHLALSKNESGEDAFRKALKSILNWFNSNRNIHLPSEAWTGEPFEVHDYGGSRLTATSIKDQFWIARFDDEKTDVAGRKWIHEIGLGKNSDGGVIFAARLLCATRGEDTPYDRSIPNYVRDIALNCSAEIDEIPIEDEGKSGPRLVTRESDVDDLIDLLESTKRRVPVILFSSQEDEFASSSIKIDIQKVFRKTLGAAHLYVLTHSASLWFTQRVGREFAVFREAIRLFKPGFSRLKSDSYSNPLILPTRINSIQAEGDFAFESWLSNRVLEIGANAVDSQEILPTFDSIRKQVAKNAWEAKSNSGESSDEKLKSAKKYIEERDIENAKTLNELNDVVRQYEIERNNADEARGQALSLVMSLRHQIEVLSSRKESKEISIPTTLDDFGQWCDENLNTVIVLKPAIKEAQKSSIRDVTLVYKALLALQNYYVPMKRNPSTEAKNAFEQEIASLYLENSLVGRALDTHRKSYTVLYNAQDRLLDMHLKEGVRHDKSFTFRAYYFYDEEMECVVVGWLPSHLPNSLS